MESPAIDSDCPRALRPWLHAIAAATLVLLSVACGSGAPRPRPLGSEQQGHGAKGSMATAIAVGHTSVCALLAEGDVACWGGSALPGSRGAPTKIAGACLFEEQRRRRDVPFPTVFVDGQWRPRAMVFGMGERQADCPAVLHPKPIAALSHGGTRCAISSDRGSVWCWDEGRPQLREPLYGAISIAGEREGELCAVLQDGAVYCYGHSFPHGVGGPRGEPPQRVPNLPPARRVFADWQQLACAASQTGDLWCWGYGPWGPDGTLTRFPLPAKVAGVGNIVTFSAGHVHACVAEAGGKVRCFGQNPVGQLGDGSTRNSARPVVVTRIPPVVALSVNHMSSCALDAEGGVWCWGADPTRVEHPHENFRVLPERIMAISGAIDLGLGLGFLCVLTRAGEVVCAGDNRSGALGVSSPEERGPRRVAL